MYQEIRFLPNNGRYSLFPFLLSVGVVQFLLTAKLAGSAGNVLPPSCLCYISLF
jgi:hypothetical protein